MAITRDYLEEIYVKMDRLEAVSDLSPQDRGRYYILTCPKCHEGEAYLYKNGVHIRCNRLNQCGYSQNLWDYIQTTKGLDNQGTLKELARLADYTLPDSNGYTEEAQRAKNRANVLESVLGFFKSQLWAEEDRKTLNYLRKDRGFTEDEIRDMSIGLYPSQKAVRDYLVKEGYTPDAINDAGLKTEGFGFTHKMVIPYRDVAGRMKGIIARALDNRVKPRYKVSSGTERDTLFNLYEAREQELVVVEDYLDALIATQRDIKGVVATGGESLTERQIENARKYGVETLIILLDKDSPDNDETDMILNIISSQGLKAYVTILPEGYNSPGELIKDIGGVHAFKECIKPSSLQSVGTWKANYILSRHNLNTDRGYDNAVKDAIESTDTIRGWNNLKHYKDVIRINLDIPESVYDQMDSDSKEVKARQREKQEYKDLLKEGQRILQDGTLSDLRDYLEERIIELREASVNKVVIPYGLAELKEDITISQKGLRTGYDSLDKIIRIRHGAVTVVAGRPSSGKTTLLMNIYLNMIKAYPEKAFFFFTYEEGRSQIALKLLMCLSGDIIDETHNLEQYESYLSEGDTTRENIETGKARFKKYTDCGRLFIIDEAYHIEELLDTLVFLTRKHDIGGVFIDCINKIGTKDEHPSRQIELQDTSRKISDMAMHLSIPVILSVQVGRSTHGSNDVRLDSLRESADIEQDANVILGLYNESMETAQRDCKILKDREIGLQLTVLKNKNGKVNETVDLIFDRPAFKIDEEIR